MPVTVRSAARSRRRSAVPSEIGPGAEILDTSGDTLRATYIQAGYRRLSIIRWVSFGGGIADFEVAATAQIHHGGNLLRPRGHD